MSRILSASRVRLITVLLFLAAAFGLFIYLFTGSASYIPLVQPKQWEAVVYLEDADNLVKAGRVMTAGVQVGKVREVVREDGRAKVTFDVDREYAPLHEGVQIRLGARSLIEDNYLDVTDGTGAPFAENAVIPDDAVVPSVQLHDVLATLDDQTRADTGAFLRTAGMATEGTQQDIAATMEGLGKLGREGGNALDALAAQSEDITKLGMHLTTVLDSLNAGQGQIASLVTDTDRLTRVTADRQELLAASVRELPPVLRSATAATDGVNALSTALGPVAAGLDEAAPSLTTALKELPATSRDLRALLPDLRGTLDRAPATLERVPRLSEDVRDLIGPTRSILRDLNPALRYLAPYGDEVGIFFANFAGVLQYRDEQGAHYIRLVPRVTAPHSVQSPVMLPEVTTYTNPFPADGQSPNPGQYVGPYPRVEQAPK